MFPLEREKKKISFWNLNGSEQLQSLILCFQIAGKGYIPTIPHKIHYYYYYYSRFFFRKYAWINYVWEDTSSYKELHNLGGEQHIQIKCFPEYKMIKSWRQPIKRSQAFWISDLLTHLSFLHTVLLIWFLQSIIFLLL